MLEAKAFTDDNPLRVTFGGQSVLMIHILPIPTRFFSHEGAKVSWRLLQILVVDWFELCYHVLIICKRPVVVVISQGIIFRILRACSARHNQIFSQLHVYEKLYTIWWSETVKRL